MGSRRKLLWSAVGLAFVLAAASAVDGSGFRRYFRLRKSQEALAARNRQSADENRALRREIELLRTDPKAIERAAREELGFVKSGEIVFIVERAP